MRGFLGKLKKAIGQNARTPEMAGAEADDGAGWDAETRKAFLEWNATTPMTPRVTDDVFASPVRLRPVMPLPGQPVSGSWIGGLPRLPEAMPWPILADKPALFLAQIDCAELPPGIWGGMGPRDGWLVFFLAQDRLTELCVRHVDGALVERIPPGDLSYPRTGHVSASLAEFVAMPHGQMPRWPVTVEPIAALPTESGVARKMMRDDLPRQEFHDDFRMHPGRHPFDWQTARLLLHTAAEDLARWDGVYRQRVESGDQVATVLLEKERAAREKLAQLIDGVEQASARARFSDEAAALVVEGLQRIRRPVEIQRESGRMFRQCPVLGCSTVMRHYLPLAEMRARAVYCADPDALPPEPRAYYERMWLADTEFEQGYMGGQPRQSFFADHLSSDAVSLLMLPTSDMIGWMWGDMSDLGIFIRPEDLRKGAWDAAWAADTQG